MHKLYGYHYILIVIIRYWLHLLAYMALRRISVSVSNTCDKKMFRKSVSNAWPIYVLYYI